MPTTPLKGWIAAEHIMPYDNAFSKTLVSLAETKRIAVRRVNHWLALSYRDGFDEMNISVHTRRQKQVVKDAKVLIDQFLRLDSYRTQVINGFRHYLHQKGHCLEQEPTGTWRCGSPVRWHYIHMDYRMSMKMQRHGPQWVLSHMIQRVSGEAVEPQVVQSLLKHTQPPEQEHSFPQKADTEKYQDLELPETHTLIQNCGNRSGIMSELVEGIAAIAHEVTCVAEEQVHLTSAFRLKPIGKEEKDEFDLLAAELIDTFKEEAKHRCLVYPHWSKMWRQQYLDGFWFRDRFDCWVDRDWWQELATQELARPRDADTLSACEVLMWLDPKKWRDRGLDELVFWQHLNDDTDDFSDCLASFFYPQHPLARKILERTDDLTPGLERAMINARHFPTLRRLSLEFKAQWNLVSKGENTLEKTWLLEQESVRRMGPTWLNAFLGEDHLNHLHDICCRTAANLRLEDLHYVCHHLVFWSASFYWPDVLTHLRANSAFPRCLGTLKHDDHARLVLAWSLIRPDNFAIRLAAQCMQMPNPLHRLAGAVAWQRCRLLPPILFAANK